MANFTRKTAYLAMSAAGYHDGDPLFDADFLVCGCGPTHEALGVMCAPVHKRASVGQVRVYECARCGAMGAYKPAASSARWPHGYASQVDQRGRPRVVGETAIGVPVDRAAPETTDPPLAELDRGGG